MGLVTGIGCFKQVNDSSGYVTGDYIMAAVSGLLGRFFSKDAMAARFGGKEFAVLRLLRSTHEILNVTEALRCKIEQLCPASVGITINIYVVPRSGAPIH